MYGLVECVLQLVILCPIRNPIPVSAGVSDAHHRYSLVHFVVPVPYDGTVCPSNVRKHVYPS